MYLIYRKDKQIKQNVQKFVKHLVPHHVHKASTLTSAGRGLIWGMCATNTSTVPYMDQCYKKTLWTDIPTDRDKNNTHVPHDLGP